MVAKTIQKLNKAVTTSLDRLSDSVRGLSADDAKPHVDPFDEQFLWLNLSADQFCRWREYFSTHSKELGEDIARIFNERRTIGHFKSPELDPCELTDAFEHPERFDRKLYDMFTGSVLGDLRINKKDKDKPLVELPTPFQLNTWGKVHEDCGEFTQRIAGSNYGLINPSSQSEVLRNLQEEKADLYFNVYTKKLLIASWTTFYQNHTNQMRSIGYSLGDKLLWLNQLLNPDMSPTIGPLTLPLPGDPVIITPNQLILSIDREVKTEIPTSSGPGQPPPVRSFEVYAMHINFFGGMYEGDKPRAEFSGPILKLKNSDHRVTQFNKL